MSDMSADRRRPLIAGNWKMNGLSADGIALARELVRLCRTAEAAAGDLLICPPATLLLPIAAAIADSPLLLGGQDCHAAAAGAHTGDISAPMLADAGCRFVIVGHSERRSDHGESDALVQAKTSAAQKAGLTAILCIGETAAQREGGATPAVIERQFFGSLPPGATADNLVVAYEPVWAIGSGEVPTIAEIAEVHRQVRRLAGQRIADPTKLRILYGGSVKPGNAAEILAIADVDGALVGGASLTAADFWAIAQSCPSLPAA